MTLTVAGYLQLRTGILADTICVPCLRITLGPQRQQGQILHPT